VTTAFKKNCIAVTGLLLAVTTQAHSVDCDPAPYCEQQMVNANVWSELLYWRPELCGLEAAFGHTAIATTLDGSFIRTTVSESDVGPTPQWDPGFRIGADFVFSCYDLEADWTHFKGRAKFGQGAQHGEWKIRYDTIDLTFGRFFCVAPNFYFKPFVGVRGAIIDQTLESRLTTLFSTLNLIGSSTVLTNREDKENAWGAGPEVGLEAGWYLGCDFTVYASLDFVTYYGRVRGKNFDVDTFTSTESASNSNAEHYFNKFATDGSLGIRWDKTVCWCCCELNFMLKLGLEQHRIYDFSNLGSDGALSLDGGNFAAGVGFCF